MSKTPSLLLLSILSFLVILKSEPDIQHELIVLMACNNEIGNFSKYDTYDDNRGFLFEKIYTDKEIDNGFYNFSYGEDPDRVYAIGFCRGDVKPDECRSCLRDSALLLSQKCPEQKEGFGYLYACMLRYSSHSILGVLETGSPFEVVRCSQSNYTGGGMFNQTLDELLDRLKSTAEDGDSRRKFAEGNATVEAGNNDTNHTIYALLQCTPYLSMENCSQCLQYAFSDISYWCLGKRGGRYDGRSCSVRYETYPFFGPMININAPAPQPPTSPVTPTTRDRQGKSNSPQTAIAIAVPVVVVVVVLVIIFIYIYLKVRRKPRKFFEIEGDDDEIKTHESLQFHFSTIRVATDDFSDSNKLGQGGFGAVYRGTLSNGKEIAVKRLSTDSRQGDIEFKNEVLLVAKLQHRNLVRLLGFCLEGREKLLVYEFVPNKSLDYFIFDEATKTQLDWQSRYNIIEGIARGILYLHEDSRLRVIHRDIKASNILLDEEMNPKISDFGMARLFGVNQIHGDTNRIVGTYGYMAPEYAMHGQFSIKSDVFSFGVLVLEILSGKKNHGIRHGENVKDLLSFAWRNWREGTIFNIVDPILSNGLQSEIMRCIHIGLLCVQENVAARPTMAAVVRMLNSDSVTLPVPSEPAFYVDRNGDMQQPWEYNSTASRSMQQLNRSSQVSVNEVSVTEIYPR